MIQPLRRGHFRIWILLAVLLPILLLAGLAAQHPTTPWNPAVNWESFK